MPSIHLSRRDPRFRSVVIRFAIMACAAAGLVLPVAGTALAQQPVTVRQASLDQQPEAIPSPGGQLTPAPAPSIYGAPQPGQPAFPTLPATQQPPPDAEVMTLEDLEQIALINNPSLGRAQALVSAARGNWVQVGLPPNFSWGYLGQQIGSGNIASQHAMLVDGELVMGGKLRWNRAVAEQEIIRAEQDLSAHQLRVLTDVRIAFYEALLAQRNLELGQQLLQIARDAQTTAQRLQRAGETSRVDVNQATIEAFTAETNLNDARQRHFAAWQTLRAVIGVPQLAPAVLRGDLESIPDSLTWEDTLGRLLSVSPEIGAAIANLDRARAVLVRARREPIPNVRFQGGPMQDQGFKGGKTDGIVQILLPLPLINRNQGAISQALAELTAAQRAVEQVELDLQNRLAPVFERYSSAAYRVRRYRESILPIAEETLGLVKSGWSAGEFPFLNLLIAQQKYAQTNQAYLQSLLDLRTSVAQIEGLLLSNGLGSNPGSAVLGSKGP